MNHELAKQLMDAGFPQEVRNDSLENIYVSLVSIPEKIGSEEHFIIVYPYNPAPTGTIRCPALSELIEACPELYTLRHFTEEWVAYPWDRDEKGVGQTPEEAVAQLWLALNEKK